MKPVRAVLPALLVTIVVLSGCSKKPAAGPINLLPLTPSPSGTIARTPDATPDPGTNTSPNPAVSGVAPGHGSPAAAYAGYLDAATQGQVATECSYVLPSEQPVCPQLMSEATVAVEGSPITIGTVDTVGTQALLVPLGTVCVDGSCLPNTDPNAGIPSSSAGFTQAYNQATQTETDPTASLGQVSGQWYLDLGTSPDASPGT